MNGSHCPEKQRLADFTSGKLPEEEASSVSQHVAMCASCEATIQSLEAKSDTLASGLRNAPPKEPYADEPGYRQAISELNKLPAGGRPKTPQQAEGRNPAAVVTTPPSVAPHTAVSMPGNMPQKPAAKPADKPVPKLGPYKLLAKLGEGGMGAVYKALHEHLGKTVAIKVLPKKAMQDQAAVARFRREMKAVGALHHPNIVGAHDAGEAQGVHYLVMEYVEGSDLSGLVKKQGPLPVDKAVSYIRQAACGLAFAHGKGVVHRDIKPANLLVDTEGTLKILDMGLARLDDGDPAAREGLTQTGQVMGTVDYMAPEQAFDTHSADGKADVYSLGCTLYRILTGHNMFAADTLVQKILAHREASIPALGKARPDAPPQLDALYQRMVAKKPEQRPTMAEVASELEALEKGPGARGPAIDVVIDTGKAESGKRKAASVAPNASPERPRRESTAKPKAKGSGHKTKPPLKWIAAGIGGFAILCLGVIIYVNGTRVEVPDNSTVAITQNGTQQPEVRVTLPTTESPKVAAVSPPSGDYALQFEDETSVELSSLTQALNLTGPLTFEAWVTPGEDWIKTTHVLPVVGNSDTGFLGLGLASNRWDFLGRNLKPGPNGAYYVDAAADRGSERQRRTHIAGVRSENAIMIFRDGVLMQSGDVPMQEWQRPSNPLTIGGRKGEWWFHGMIDEVRVSKIARYENDFTPQARFAPDADTLALYHFDEGGGDILHDASGNKHDGKIVGARWVRSDGSLIATATGSPVYTQSTAVDPERRVAEWVLGRNGKVRIAVSGGEREIAKLADLPAEPFVVLKINRPEVKTPITSTEWQSVGELRAATDFDFSGCDPTDEALAAMARCRTLRWLTIAFDDTYGDAGLAEIAKLPHLAGLDIGNCAMTAAGLEHLGKLTRLRSLKISSTKKLEITSLAALAGLQELEVLELNSTTAGDAAVADLKVLPRLKHLNLAGSRVSPAVTDSLLGCTNLRVVLLSEIRLTTESLRKLSAHPTLSVVYLKKTGLKPEDYEQLVVALPRITLVHTDLQTAYAEELAAADWAATVGTLSAGSYRAIRDANEAAGYGTDFYLQKPIPAEELRRLAVMKNITMLAFASTHTSQHVRIALEALREHPNLGTFIAAGVPGLPSSSLAELPRHTDLRFVSFSTSNETTDETLNVLASLPNLRKFQIDSTQVTDKVFEHLAKMPKLETVTLGCSRINGTGLAALRNAPRLNVLQLGKTSIVDTSLPPLAGLPELEQLNLESTKITDAGLVHLAGCRELRILNVKKTKVTAAGVAKLQAALSRCTIFWDGASATRSEPPTPATGMVSTVGDVPRTPLDDGPVGEMPPIELGNNAANKTVNVGFVVGRDGRHVAVYSNYHLRWQEIATGRVVWDQPLKPYLAYRRLDISKDGRIVALAGTWGTGNKMEKCSVYVFNTADGSISKSVDVELYVTALALSPDGALAALGRHDGLIQLLDIQTSQLVGELVGHTTEVKSLAFSPNGRLLASTTAVANLADPGVRMRLWDVEGRKEARPLEQVSANTTVSFTGDGRILLAGSRDNSAAIWDTTSGEHLGLVVNRTSTAHPATEIFPSGRHALCAGTTLIVADIANHKILQEFGKQGDTPITQVKVTPDGRFAITAAENDSVLRVWRLPPEVWTSGFGAIGTASANPPWNTAAFQQWIKETQALPAEQQIEAVSKKLMELNPGFDGKLTGYTYGGANNPKIENGVVVELGLLTDHVENLAPLRAFSGLRRLLCSGSIPRQGRLVDLSPLAGLPLTNFGCAQTQVADLSPLAGMPLKALTCNDTQVADLTPLVGTPLTDVRIFHTAVSNLTPLKGMKIGILYLHNTPVSDLSSLAGMPLTSLNCSETQVSDLTPLRGMQIPSLWFHDTLVSDITPLEGMPLKSLRFTPANITRGIEVVRAMTTLTDLGLKHQTTGSDVYTPAEFWKKYDAGEFARSNAPTKLAYLNPAFQQWVEATQKLPAEQQVEAVRQKLIELNPGFDGRLTGFMLNSVPAASQGVVTEVGLQTDRVTDISPVQAFSGLTGLRCAGGQALSGSLTDLSPLSGMSLQKLNVDGNKNLSSLAPLQGMKLTYFQSNYTAVTDFTTLLGMPLTYLHTGSANVADLSWMKGMPLEVIYVTGSFSDLKPLQGMPLKRFSCFNSQVSDLSPLKGLPLTTLGVDNAPLVDLSPLGGLKQLTYLTVLKTKVTAEQVASLQKALPNCKIVWDDPAKAVKSAGHALEFDGVDDVVEVPSIGDSLAAPLTLEAWVTPEDVGVAQTNVIVVGVDDGPRFKIKRVGGSWHALAGDGTQRWVSASLTPGRRVHIAAVFSDRSQVTLFVEGVAAPTVALAPEIAKQRISGLLRIGYAHGSGNEPAAFAGVIDQLRVSSTARYAENFTPFTELAADTATLALYRFDEGTGDVLHDSSGKNHHGQITGARWVAVPSNDAAAKKLAYLDPSFERWVKQTQALTAEKQVEAVSKKLMELNPRFDGKLSGRSGAPPAIENGTVTVLSITPDFVTDLSPLLAWRSLKVLELRGTPGRGRLSDLSPLKGLQLTTFTMNYTKVTDLSPLVGMPLTWLNTDVKLADLSFLKGMPLKTLYAGHSALSDLSPLRGMPLEHLYCWNSQVADLTPLAECKNLKVLSVTKTKVTAETVAALQKALPNCKIEWDDPLKSAPPAKK